ncbi:MAG: heavy metal-responsive transcriptional regulator [Chroococcus sp. CMT-3BRIN-NPC107]|jgi:DNA-binding transcriptional MerR regulator|nr:heavy metal-responsive transcriptional regulator [Chroococcus sp. CMT-3BRIN-NPC107]
MPKLLLIGQVTALSKVPIRTIRYYESLGLIESGRTEGGFRQFDQSVLARLAFIKRSQGLGLSLQEIGELLKVYDRGQLPCDDIQARLKNKIVEIDKQIDELLTLRTELGGILSGWENFNTLQAGTICPVIQKSNFE